ncbi:MAG: hypothetical protein OEQ39_06825 [Gammaproteobacteria bacterium]|nr:hypothetical protein [Gammaproteobacteria bacterium]MDH3467214.1 hypothetical protein [Gammaproteobacteria bacterium]
MSLQTDVAGVFNDLRVHRIDFHLGGVHIGAARLRQVGNAIKNGRIGVVVRSTGSQVSAGYSHHSNLMTLSNNNMINRMLRRTAIIHEGVHALVDMFRAPPPQSLPMKRPLIWPKQSFCVRRTQHGLSFYARVGDPIKSVVCIA